MSQEGVPQALGTHRLTRLVSRRGPALVISLLVALLTVAAGASWDLQNMVEHRKAQERRVLEMLGFWRGRLESELNTRLHLVHGLAGLVHAERQVDEKNFQRFAEKIAGNVSAIRSLQLAPNGVVLLVWPLETNQAAIGHDLLGDPARRAAAEQAIRARGIWIAGPLRLIQGGVAIIGRRPIFLQPETGEGPERFWGFATILIDLPEMMQSIGMPVEKEGVQFALRGVDARGTEGDVFFGAGELFEADSMRVSVALPAGSWELAGMPMQGWSGAWSGQRLFRLILLVVAALLGCLFFNLLRMPGQLRERVDEALMLQRREERRFQDAFESLQEGFAVFDENDRLVVCNERLRQLYAHSADALQPGRPFAEIIRYGVENGQYKFIQDPSRAQVDAYVQGRLALHRQPDVHFEEELTTGRWLQVMERPMRDGGTVSFYFDITEAKQKERELVEAKKRAEIANAAKTAFLATVSHEVRTPLNSVLGLLGLICEAGEMPSRELERARTAHASARHLLVILNEILDISKMEEGRFELESGPFCPAETARDVLRLVEGLAGEKSVAVSLTLEGEGLGQAFVTGDEGRFRQVLLNLVSNAVKFTDEGRVEVFLRTRGVRDGMRQLEFMVMDTGVGFDGAQARKLFEPFSQLENHAGRRFGGTGLGLAICKRLIDLMGGEIHAEGRPGAGAVFTVRVALPHCEGTIEREPPGEGDAQTPLQRGWRNIRVLLVEDSPTNQLVFEAMMDGTGYLVDVASSGEEAVEILRELSYDLIMMDVYMPGMDGLETTQVLRNLPGCSATPVIALTANAMQGDRERFLEAGMDDYLPKPIDKRDLLELMARWTAKVLDGDASDPSSGVHMEKPDDRAQRGTSS